MVFLSYRLLHVLTLVHLVILATMFVGNLIGFGTLIQPGELQTNPKLVPVVFAYLSRFFDLPLTLLFYARARAESSPRNEKWIIELNKIEMVDRGRFVWRLLSVCWLLLAAILFVFCNIPPIAGIILFKMQYTIGNICLFQIIWALLLAGGWAAFVRMFFVIEKIFRFFPEFHQDLISCARDQGYINQ